MEATREGFAPDTIYICSVFTSTRAGDGPSVNRTVRTLEARKIYHRVSYPMYVVYLILYLYPVAPEEPQELCK